MAILAPCPGVVGSVRVDSFDQASIAVGNGSRGCAGTNPKLIADLALSHRIATAKVLGIILPTSVLLRADEVVE